MSATAGGGMDAGNVSAIISAAAGISGVLLGNSFVAIKEFVIGWRRRKKETEYLAIIVVSHLDRFANGCSAVAYDDGTEYGRPAGQGGICVSTVAAPEFLPLDLDVQWKALPKDLMYAILLLPDQREQIQNKLAALGDLDDDPPYYPEYFWTRQRDYADLGLQASNLAQRLREHAKMPPVEHKPGEWNRDQALTDVIKTLDERREAYERRRAAHVDFMSSSDPAS
ncbi:hypothetical protein [Paludibacterium yongneupense]|uniref:hypothetical protein n=1 Tax=Paludibacterium yongneupense TaxID=400061 RepID=UPI001B7FC922|nr:hypothetical protein [Paludibacterium yongneupense]